MPQNRCTRHLKLPVNAKLGVSQLFPTLQNQVPLSALLNTSSDYLTDCYIIILYILFILSYSCMILLIKLLANYAIEYLFATKKLMRIVENNRQN